MALSVEFRGTRPESAGGADPSAVPVAPGRRPLVGHATELARRPLEFLRSLSDVGGLVRVDLGPRPLYVVTPPKLAYELLTTQSGRFDRGRFGERLRPVVGYGLTASDGELHRRQRRLMQPAFQRDRIGHYAATMLRQARELAESWQPGQTVDVEEAMYDLSLATICETLFSSGLTPGEMAEVRRCLPVIADGMTSRPLAPRILDRLPLPGNRRFTAAAARLGAIVDRVLRTRLAGPPEAEHADLVSLLLAARDPETGEPMDPRQVRDESISIMLAGTDAIATTLAWAWYEIGADPGLERRLWEEVDAAALDEPGAPDRLTGLRLTGRIVTETTRLHPVMLLAWRRALEPVRVAGYRLPAGAEITFSPYAAFREPSLFPDPTRFDPDRWLGTAPRIPRDAFIPFGAGSRKCIGEHYATLHMVTVIATLASRWRLRPTPGTRVREIPGIMPRPSGVVMTAEPR